MSKRKTGVHASNYVLHIQADDGRSLCGRRRVNFAAGRTTEDELCRSCRAKSPAPKPQAPTAPPTCCDNPRIHQDKVECYWVVSNRCMACGVVAEDAGRYRKTLEAIAESECECRADASTCARSVLKEVARVGAPVPTAPPRMTDQIFETLWADYAKDGTLQGLDWYAVLAEARRARAEVAAKDREIERLVARLERWGHDSRCAMTPCDCGMAEIVEDARAALKEPTP